MNPIFERGDAIEINGGVGIRRIWKVDATNCTLTTCNPGSWRWRWLSVELWFSRWFPKVTLR